MQGAIMDFPSIDQSIGNTRLVRLQRMPGNTSNIILAKMEGDNPAGSVKDRPAVNMIMNAQLRGEIAPGDHLIEATSGNTGIALAMAAAMMGYRMTLIMPITATIERKMAMRAYGAELIEVTAAEGMEGARDQALKMQSEGLGKVLDQFNNTDNPLSHFEGTGPEIWRDTGGTVTHFVSSMGTTGTIMGVSAYLKEKNPLIEIIGLQPEEGASIPGIRRWPKAYLPGIFDAAKVDTTLDVSQQDAEETMRRLAKEEGIFCGASAGGAVFAALKLSEQLNNAVIVTIICDRGDRYLSSGVYG
jgi:cysteine synthase B